MAVRKQKNIIVQKFVRFLLIVAFGLSVMNIETTTNIVVAQEEPKLDTSYGTQYTKEQIGGLISFYSVKYGVDSKSILATIECESHFKNVQSDIYSDGVREDSWGIAQINLPSHPKTTKDEALDPVYSAEFIVKEFGLGNSWMWSCYKNGLYLKYL